MLGKKHVDSKQSNTNKIYLPWATVASATIPTYVSLISFIKVTLLYVNNNSFCHGKITLDPPKLCTAEELEMSLVLVQF